MESRRNKPAHGCSLPAFLALCLVFGATATSVAEDKAVKEGRFVKEDIAGKEDMAGKDGDVLDKAAAERLFTLRVLPLLKVKCFGCHGQDPKDVRGDYNLLTREAMIQGGESEETALVPGNPDESPLFQAILWNGSEMPPKENDRLSMVEAEYFRKWISAGAPWPGAAAQLEIQKKEWSIRENEDGVIVDTVGGLADDWTYRRYQPEDIWAFQPVKKPKIPTGPSKSGSGKSGSGKSGSGKSGSGESRPNKNPIDAFINRRLVDAELTASATADFRTLIRRATYGLTGLPPSPKEVSDFRQEYEQDPQQAWANLIDRLLKSEHYGERWAQHWLDVVRYADTAGFSNDYERSNAWRYRDYVIRAFNNDKPYNEFVVEQLAGDELRPDDPEANLATGLLRMGPWGTAMIPQPEARQIYLDDLVHNVGQTFLSMPMRCCKCHDHKFDPLPTRDYYSLYAAFATTQPAEANVPFLPEENLNGFDEKRKLTQELLRFARAEYAQVEDKQEAAAKKWYEEHNLPYKKENARKGDPEDQKPPRHVGLTSEEKGVMKVRRQDVWIWTRRLERYQPMAQTVYNGPDNYKDGRKLRAPAQINQQWRPENFILGGGSLAAPSMPVTPGVLSATGLPTNPPAANPPAANPPAANPPATNPPAASSPAASSPAQADPQKTDPRQTDPFRITEELNGRRLELAQWIAHQDNPLTARSIVNRVWQYHFGKGLVKTANNFGAKGGKPTHPELLDWLTADFVENGWKIKRLHRLIMTSDVYRRSGRPVAAERQATVDPNNNLLASFPPRRLTAEELRDSSLLVSGELNPEMGGVPIMPEINMEVALQPRMIQFSIAPAHQPSRTPAERNRRTIYTYRVRGQPDPLLDIMNLPNPNESCEMRDSAAVSPQAFTLMNSDVMTDRSIAFAARVQKERPGDTAQWIRRAVQIAYSRLPTAAEQKSLHDYLQEMRAYHQENRPEPVEYPTQVTRSLVEEFTGQPFDFIEKLNVYEDYVPDAKPWTVDADRRALADICLLLLNSNEFLYVY